MWNSPDWECADVFVPKIDESFFVIARERAKPYRCTEADIQRFGALGEAIFKVHCVYENHVYYQTTDAALYDIIDGGCPWCTHVLVTNSDNTYHPNFLLRMLEQHKDLVASNFIDREVLPIVAEMRKGYMDLGGILFSKRVLEKVGGFINALPENSGAQEVHDNDYWFVNKTVEAQFSTAFVPYFIFSHN